MDLTCSLPSALNSTGFQTLLWSAPVGPGFAVKRTIFEMNDSLCAMCGYSREEMIGLNLRQLYETDAEYDRVGTVKYPQLEASGWSQIESRWKRKDGTVIDVRLSSALMQPGDLSMGVAFMVQDITDRKRTERSLLVQNARWYELFDDSPEGIVLLDTEFRYVVANSEFMRLFEYSNEELAVQPPRFLLVPDDLQHEADEAVARLAEGQTVRYENTIRLTKDGRRIPVSVLSKPIRLDECNIGVYSIYRDISGQVSIETELRQSLHEKEVLLKEVHHRVKNNLNIISSLLSLQKAEIASNATDEPLELARSRVHSMAMIHDLLYRSKNFAEVPFKQYLEDLTGYLRSSFGSSTNRIDFVFNVAEVGFDVDTAVPCGLLINEIVVNSMKHAFPANRHGSVFLGLSVTDTHYVLCIGDDGVGIPESVDFDRAQTMGLELIRGLCSQLTAELHRDFSNGTKYRVLIPRKNC